MTTLDDAVPCAYCHRTDVPMTEIDSIPTNSGAGFPVYCCRDCITGMGGTFTDAAPASAPCAKAEGMACE